MTISICQVLGNNNYRWQQKPTTINETATTTKATIVAISIGKLPLVLPLQLSIFSKDLFFPLAD